MVLFRRLHKNARVLRAVKLYGEAHGGNCSCGGN